jgi:hypothetical protein
MHVIVEITYNFALGFLGPTVPSIHQPNSGLKDIANRNGGEALKVPHDVGGRIGRGVVDHNDFPVKGYRILLKQRVQKAR